uniref:Hyccin PI4KA lipid kinase complex subunit 1 n=1 Tax=Homo sapiens TaxID=9606 RepID=A0A7P0TBJ9_HUMAN
MFTSEKGVVEEWLSEFKTLPETSLPNYATNLKDKSSLVSSLYKVIQEPQSEWRGAVASIYAAISPRTNLVLPCSLSQQKCA